MKSSVSFLRRVLPLLLSSGLLAAAAGAEPRFLPAKKNAIENEWLVLLQDHVGSSALRPNAGQPPLARVAEKLAKAFGGEVLNVWGWTSHGFSLRISPENAVRLSRHPSVRMVEQNALLEVAPSATIHCTDIGEASTPPDAASTFSPQAISCIELDPREMSYNCVDNWGLARSSSADVPIFSPSTLPVYSYDFDGSGVHVYVIDTGIDAGHDEFRESNSPGSPSRIGEGYNAVFPTEQSATLDDCTPQSHGTHVAAIVGGLRYGVAKGVILHPIKFQDSCAPCTTNVCGGSKEEACTAVDRSVMINYSIGSPRAAINFSANFRLDEDVIDHSILVLSVNNAISFWGIPFVQSAGNQFDYVVSGQVRDACSMTLTNNGIIVGATDLEDLGTGLTDVRWVVESEPNSGPGVVPDLECASTGSSNPCLINCNDNGNDTRINCGSNTGSCIDVWAPGAHIVSAQRDTANDNCHLAGTSMAAPHVTGLVAQLLQRYPSATSAELELAVRDYGVPDKLHTDSASFPHYSIKNSPNLLFQTQAPVVTDAWVDFNHTNSIELGTSNLPFDLLAEGLAETDAGQTLHVKAGSMAGAVTIDQHVTIVAEGGTVTLGQ